MRPPVTIPTSGAIRAAQERMGGIARRTSCVRFGIEMPPGTPGTLREVYLKLETEQPIGSFKIRGAASAVMSASAESLAGGVWTASAGNMAQGAAWMARLQGIPCRVIVPDQIPQWKLDAITALGASYEKVPFDAWWQAMLTHAHPGMTGLLIHPFADTVVMAGNGTIGLELAEDVPDLDAVLIPWGGGGLSLGIAAALRDVSPRTKVYAVEVETAAPLTASLAAGKPVTVTRTQTFIDGIGSDRVSDETWPLVTRLIAGTIVVTVAQVAAAMKLLVDTANVAAEGAGAASVAAALGGRLNGVSGSSLGAARVACIISGGNIKSGHQSA